MQKVTRRSKGNFCLEVCVCVPAQPRPSLCDLMDLRRPGSSVCEVFQARILEWVFISFPKGSSPPRNRTCDSCLFCIGKQILYHWATWESFIQHVSNKILHCYNRKCHSGYGKWGHILTMKCSIPSMSVEDWFWDLLETKIQGCSDSFQ